MPDEREPARTTLRSKFVLLVTLLVGIVMALETVVTLSRERTEILRRVVQKGEGLTRTLARLLEGKDTEGVSLLKPVLATMANDDEIEGISVEAGTGAVLLSLSRVNRPIEAEVLPDLIFGDDLFDVRYYLALGDSLDIKYPFRLATGPGEIRARLSLLATKVEIRKAASQALLVTALTLVFGFFMARFLADVALGPLTRFLQATRAVVEGDYERELPREGPEEIVSLTDNFNLMLERLREKEALEARLHQADKLAAIGQLAAGVAHEIRNPLASVRSLTEMIAKESLPRAAQVEHLNVVIRSVDRINKVVEKLLNYARPHSRTVAAVDLHVTVSELAVLVTPSARKRGVRIVVEHAATRPAWACADEVTQVLLNLILNAIEAMPNQGTITIRTADAPGSEPSGDEVTVSVRDTGHGIPEPALSHLFEPFFTTKVGGTGLGLNIAKRLVETNGGRITVVSSTPGASPAASPDTSGPGTTFTVHLGAFPGSGPPPPPPPPPRARDADIMTV